VGETARRDGIHPDPSVGHQADPTADAWKDPEVAPEAFFLFRRVWVMPGTTAMALVHHH